VEGVLVGVKGRIVVGVGVRLVGVRSGGGQVRLVYVQQLSVQDLTVDLHHPHAALRGLHRV
jgi:hypothetical protein